MISQNNNEPELSLKYKNIQQYMLGRRMCSIENLAEQFNIPLDELYPILNMLKKNNIIRIATKNCGSNCGNCSTSCENDQLDSTAIIISLETREEPNDS